MSNYQPDDRLNDILDKINEFGKPSLTKFELEFLNSYSKGDQEITNEKLLEIEKEKTFLSDDGNFQFILEKIDIIEDTTIYSGILIVPSIKVKAKIIHGQLFGCITKYGNGEISLDFGIGDNDVFDFVNGLEYELDSFIDEIVSKLQKNSF
jgi:hypothetical protein